LLQEEKDNQLPNESSEPINNTLNNLKKCIADDDGVLRHNTELSNTHSIVLSKATAKWTNIQTSKTLENINLSVASGRLIGIIGPVGAGKVCNKLYTNCNKPYFKMCIAEFIISSYSTRIATFRRFLRRTWCNFVCVSRTVGILWFNKTEYHIQFTN